MRLFEVVVWSAAVAGVWAAAPHRLVPPRPNPFAPRGRGVTPYSVDAPFSAWPQLNDAAFASAVGVSARRRVEIRAGSPLEQLYSNDTLQAKLLAALSRRNAVDRKEYFETFEFFSQVRSGCVSPEAKTLIDVAGGHGLLGALFAVFEARFDSVVIVDTRRPPSYDAVVDALAEVAPWACGKLRYEARDVAETALPRGAAIACVHGCNTLTDVVIDLAVRDHAQSLAVMPCCYKQTARAAPPALSKAFGVDVASDVHRTYDLEARGFDVQWKAIPKAITPMNRILLARRRQTTQENSASPCTAVYEHPIAGTAGLSLLFGGLVAAALSEALAPDHYGSIGAACAVAFFFLRLGCCLGYADACEPPREPHEPREVEAAQELCVMTKQPLDAVEVV
ncbi:hypothetical protein M885DRAFT_616793 [Pelagophyceae sp. CCMP2097]|nr:hypothetical protein M885DRAFT_616793 [Pelagophyceae sp. CCMP2097]